jgi:large subunit ribosomal protein L3
MKEPAISSIVAFKAGMTHALVTDDSESMYKGMEISRPCTILEIPSMEVYGIRLYSKEANSGYREPALEIVNSNAAKKLNIKEAKSDEKSLGSIKARLNEFNDATAMIASYPKGLGVGQHHPMRFEAYIGGSSVEEKFNFLSGILGKEVRASEIFKSGEYVDVTSISKGKGWQGPVKRAGIATQWHKASGHTRQIGSLGTQTPRKVFYTIPRAGQMGFNYRTEHNKRILKIGTAGDAAAAPSAGIANYGVIRGDYLIVGGSIPGPARRLVRIRKSITNRNAKGIKEPKLTYIKSK